MKPRPSRRDDPATQIADHYDYCETLRAGQRWRPALASRTKIEHLLRAGNPCVSLSKIYTDMIRGPQCVVTIERNSQGCENGPV